MNTSRATRFGSLLMGAGALALAACSAGDEADGMPSYGNVPAFGNNGNGAQNNNTTQNPAANGSTNNGSTQSPAASNGSNNNGSNNTGSQSTPPAQQNNGSQPSGNQTGSAQEGNPNTAPISNGNNNNGSANNGSAGSSGNNTGNTAGSSGAMAPGAGGNTGNPMPPVDNGNQNPPPANNGNQNPPSPTAPDITCPSGAFFCSGFENGFPAGTTNITGGGQVANGFQLDTTQKHSGAQSFLVPLVNQGFSYRVMGIPVTNQAFWARMFIQTDTLFGDQGHDALFAISNSDVSVDNNNETRIEFAEQEGTICLNRSTDVITFPITRPTTMTANVFHCVEARFDGNAGDFEVFVDGTQIISALGKADFKFQYKTLRIGNMTFHEPRNVWFDDVILSTQRVGCGQ